MPDWFYRTVSQPALFRLPAKTGRDLALGFMGSLSRFPMGLAVIDFLGHMRPDARLRRTFLGIDFPATVGLGPWLDGRVVALPALARFGFGFLEVGPVTVAGGTSRPALERRLNQEAIWLSEPPESISLATAIPRLAELGRARLPIMVRMGVTPGSTAAQAAAECQHLIRELAAHTQLLSLSTLRGALADRWSVDEWKEHLNAVFEVAQTTAPRRPLLLCTPLDAAGIEAESLLDAALGAGASGFLVDGLVRGESNGWLIGLPAHRPALEQIERLRRRYGADVLLVGAGGVHEPEHALALRAAGADLIQVDTGLVYSGPGLPKRINNAILFAVTRGDAVARGPVRATEMTWLWTTLMGAGMLFGSILALVIAATRVVLPYDEAFVGMSRDELAQINPRLLAFMAHDRVSLAGTMVAIGVMYVGLSLYGIRQGLLWARQTVFISAFTGFASFFLFLGFGYLDTFHAFVTAVLLQLLLLGVHSRLGEYVPTDAPALRGSRVWRRGLWGQLLLIVHGFALLGAGTAISAIGVTGVFVHEDLVFMQTSAETLHMANPRLVPLIAHDRATFGGMLLSAGWAFLLPALWGFRRGAAWLWWALLTAGLAAYVAAIGVHFAVGYTELMHLVPAFAGLILFLMGLALSFKYLCRSDASV